MHIRTQVFAITRGEFIQVVMVEYLMRHWWLYLLFLVAALLLPGLGILPLPLTLLGLVVFFIPLELSVLSLWRFTRAEENRSFFRRMYCEIDPEFMTFHYEDGGMGRMPLRNVVRVRRMTNYYLLYTTQTQFVYLPHSVFPSEEAVAAFDAALQAVMPG